MKQFFITLFLVVAGSMLLSAQENAFSVQELRALTAPGNKVAVVFEDLTDDFDEKDAYIKAYLQEWSQWEVVESHQQADFILYVEGRAQHTLENTPLAKTYYLAPTIRRKDGTDAWKGETVQDWAHLANGFRAVKGVSWQLVRSLILGLDKALGGTPVFVDV